MDRRVSENLRSATDTDCSDSSAVRGNPVQRDGSFLCIEEHHGFPTPIVTALSEDFPTGRGNLLQRATESSPMISPPPIVNLEFSHVEQGTIATWLSNDKRYRFSRKQC